MRALRLVFLSGVIVLLHACSSTGSPEATQKNARLKAEIIKQEGKYGTLQEERVRAMSSETRYIPNGSKEGYLLVDPSLADPKENSHGDPDKPVIGNFVIGKW